MEKKKRAAKVLHADKLTGDAPRARCAMNARTKQKQLLAESRAILQEALRSLRGD